ERGQAAAQGQGGGGFADATLLVGNGPDTHQCTPLVAAGWPASGAGAGVALSVAAAACSAAVATTSSASASALAAESARMMTITRRLRLRPSGRSLLSRGRNSP